MQHGVVSTLVSSASLTSITFFAFAFICLELVLDAEAWTAFFLCLLLQEPVAALSINSFLDGDDVSTTADSAFRVRGRAVLVAVTTGQELLLLH